jgi:hypothetical protein
MSEALTPIRAIRKHCLDCQGGHYKEVRLCPSADCTLHPYRMGKRPRSDEHAMNQIGTED